MAVAIDPELEQRIADEVDRMAEILGKDTPPISFEEAMVLDTPAHTSFRDDTLLISSSSAQTLSFDQLRTSIAYTLATLTLIEKMYWRTKIAWVVGALATIALVVFAFTSKLFDVTRLLFVFGAALFVLGRKGRSWRRISESDALVYRLVGQVEPVMAYIQTKGFRNHHENLPDRLDVVERRIAALQMLARN